MKKEKKKIGKGKTASKASLTKAIPSESDALVDPAAAELRKPKHYVSRAVRRRHLDERLQSLQHRVRIIESQLMRLESRFYRICIFGSARIKPDTKIYNEVIELARLLSSEGIDILTGGGPGLMEAANMGAQLGKKQKNTNSRSYGLSIELEWEPVPNPHLDVKRHHHKFSSRLDDFMRLSHAIVCTPGGIGTILELMFSWQLIQVKHMTPRPVVLMDRKFWTGLIEWMRGLALERGLVSAKDFDSIKIVDTPEEVFEILKAHHREFLKNRPKLEEISREY